MPAESKSSIQLANKYIMKNSKIKRTSTYNRIVKFHDEYMIAHNGIVSVPSDVWGMKAASLANHFVIVTRIYLIIFPT